MVPNSHLLQQPAVTSNGLPGSEAGDGCEDSETGRRPGPQIANHVQILMSD